MTSVSSNHIWSYLKNSIQNKGFVNKLSHVWLESISFLGNGKDSSFTLQVPSDLHKKWVEENIPLNNLEKALKSRFNKDFSLKLEVASSLPVSKQNSQPFLKPKEAFSSLKRQSASSFSPDYMFENFIVGKNNEFAHGSAFSVAKNIANPPKYTPLFIYGPSGLGKTHLLHAIGNFLSKENLDKKVLYISAERFLNECVESIRKKDMENFKKKYRKTYDVLLVDDFQMIAKGNHVQEEFFHTLNELHAKNKQVVVCCDKKPSEIPGLQERIQSRLDGGLVVDIFYPDIETKLAILQYKADQKNIHLSTEVMNKIARICMKSIREIEGILNKIKMLSELKGLVLSSEEIEKILKTSRPASLSVEEIETKVCKKFNIDKETLKSKRRFKNVVVPRQICMYLIKKHLKKSLNDIGLIFGGKDHSTVLSACRKIEGLKEKNQEFKKILEDLDKEINTVYKN